MEKNREFTFRAVVIGLVLSLAMAAANMYLGLKVGITISANIPCSVIALILFHTILRTRSMAEVNLSQATGSVGRRHGCRRGFCFSGSGAVGRVQALCRLGLAGVCDR